MLIRFNEVKISSFVYNSLMANIRVRFKRAPSSDRISDPRTLKQASSRILCQINFVKILFVLIMQILFLIDFTHETWREDKSFQHELY